MSSFYAPKAHLLAMCLRILGMEIEGAVLLSPGWFAMRLGGEGGELSGGDRQSEHMSLGQDANDTKHPHFFLMSF